ncbi:hypothetical protein LguiB_013773 [Lonicera macranthoides]
MQTPPPQPPTTTTTTTTKDHKTTTLYLLATSLFSLLFLFSLSKPHPPTPSPPSDPFLFPNPLFSSSSSDPTHNPLPPNPPSIAYLISGSTNDSGRILRLLFSIYHPKNTYLLHLDRSATQTERDSLALTVQSVPIFRSANNVNVIGKPDFSYPEGSSLLSSTLRGASILLRLSGSWDWFINLSAADYPLVTQDDLLHILSYLPKDLNFVNHTSYIGWRESRKLKPIIVDPGLYFSEKKQMFYATEKRELPDAYRLFTGSPSAILSRKFIEFIILGTENLPRTLLMYLSNTASSQSFYFPTAICNSRHFNKTIINRSLQYSIFNSKNRPTPLNISNFDDMIQSGAAFASPFLPDDQVLNRIDLEVLSRGPGNLVPGGWCLAQSGNDTCTSWGDADVLRPGPGARRLEEHIVKLLSNGTFRYQQCISE